MRRRTKVALGLLSVALVGALSYLVTLLRHGFSARDEPSRLEHVLARALRRYAVPSDLKDRRNPVPLSPAVLAEARAHFADHCAMCHGNDGKGRTAIGQAVYPRAPDMTLAETQSQSDGALFATIENGIRLTAMPAWGDGSAGSAYASWTLVHFIRRLPEITPEEIAEMEKLNPKPPAGHEALRKEEAFLAGEEPAAPAGQPAPRSGGHHH